MANCNRCDATLVEVLTTVGGEELTMASCSHCDTREWRRGDEVIDLRTVLDLTADANPSRRPKASEQQPATPGQ